MIENAISVCVNYDDYLMHTLPSNRRFFTNFYIITDTKNEKTLKPLVDQYDIKLVVTNRFYEGGASFNKGKAINVALKKISPGWVCHLDADIILPENFKADNLEEDTIYGLPRKMCPNIEEFKKFTRDRSTADNWPPGESFGLNKATTTAVRRNILIEHLKRKPEEAHRYIPFFPIGYFQLFYHHPGLRYPENALDASWSDVLFAVKWDKMKELDYNAVHLPILEGKVSDNWWGRKTAKFDPDIKD
jgi:hypothetical protein